MSNNERNTSSEKSANTGAWMVTFSDLIMLMLSFFILLLSMSSVDQKMLKELFSHLREDAGVLEFSGYGEIQSLATVVEKYNKTLSKIVIGQDRFADLLIPMAESLKKAREKIKNLNELMDIKDDERGIVLSFQDNILFDPGKIKIKKESYAFLDSIADAIAASPNDILIMGHTDNTPVESNKYESNWELSAYRGIAVLEYFLNEKELTSERFFVGGYGSSKPLFPNDNPKNKSLNRRVEVIFKHLGEI